MNGFSLHPLHLKQSPAAAPFSRMARGRTTPGAQAFHRALPRLYDLAEQCAAENFLQDALNLLQPWLDADGALVWQGDIAAGAILQAGIGGLQDRGAPDAHACLTALDRGIAQCLLSLQSPLVWRWADAAAMLPRESLAWMERAGCRHLLLVGDAPVFERPARWLLLYRAGASEFGAAEAAALQIAWLHLVRATDMHRARLLERHDAARSHRATAIATMRGRVMAADANFRRLLAEEWPGGEMAALPPELIGLAAAGRRAHRGRRIEVTLIPHGRYMVCRATPLSRDADLTPGEYMVARRYATGLSHKKIARELGVSPHTVRNQIAHLYSKLGIHDKAALALYLTVSSSQAKRLA